jgi:hypothetical protein
MSIESDYRKARKQYLRIAKLALGAAAAKEKYGTQPDADFLESIVIVKTTFPQIQQRYLDAGSPGGVLPVAWTPEGGETIEADQALDHAISVLSGTPVATHLALLGSGPVGVVATVAIGLVTLSLVAVSAYAAYTLANLMTTFMGAVNGAVASFKEWWAGLPKAVKALIAGVMGYIVAAKAWIIASGVVGGWYLFFSRGAQRRLSRIGYKSSYKPRVSYS